MFETIIDSPGGILSWVGNKTERYLEIPVEATRYFFRNFAVKYGDLTANALDMYTIGSVNREGKAYFASMDVPEYMLQARGSGCSWDPYKGFTTGLDESDMCAWKFQGEQCADALWNSCLEKVLGTGIDITDFLGTPEGSALFTEIIRNVNIGLGNSYYMMAWFGLHPMIQESNTYNSWVLKTDAKRWANFQKNQATCGGLMTAIDHLKNVENIPHFNVEISNSELSADSRVYIGDAKGLLDRVIDAATYDFNLVNENNIAEGTYPIIKVTPSIFKRLKEQNSLTSFAEVNLVTLNYMLKGKDDDFKLGPNTLMYNGYMIVRDDIQARFDGVTGTITHRALMAIPGVFGIAHDTTALDQYGGLGMRLFQDLRPKEGGLLTMDSYGKIATKIINSDFLVNASRSFSPEYA